MASRLLDEGQYDESIVCYNKVTETIKSTLGKDHMSLFVAYNVIAKVLEAQGDIHEAVKFSEKALSIKRKMNHPYTWNS